MKKKLSLLLFLVGSITIPGIFFKPAIAQVTPDGTTNTTVNAEGNDLTIQNGDRAGNNLFHSFQDFSVPNGGEAFFDNAADIANILSRVTGRNISNIDGLIRANGSANLFLINPAGIIFGENASLNIGGSFYGSTADSILFEDGEFSATDLDNPPLLTINAPIGLSFRDNPGEITNLSSVPNSAEEFVGLEVNPGNNLALIGGNINFERGNLTAPGGNIELGGLSQAGTVGINDDGSLSFPGGVTKADVNLNNGADVDARGTGGGSISVNARNLNLSPGEFGSSFIRAGIRAESTSAEAQAGDVTIDVAENITLNDSRILNRVNTDGVGNSGNITITAGSIEAMNSGQVSASTFGQGDAGDVTIDTGTLTLRNGGEINSDTSGQGNAGLINIIASDTITIDGVDSGNDDSDITSEVNSEAVGNAGDITIDTGTLVLSNGGEIETDTSGQGNAGSVNITATDTITIDGGEDSAGFTGVRSSVGSGAEGDSGDVTIDTANLTLTAGGQVDTSTSGQGNGGNVQISATDTIAIDGAGTFVVSGVGSGAEGDSGDVIIDTNNLTLANEGFIITATSGQGNGGNVEISATDTIAIDGAGTAVLSSVGSGAEGDSGDVTIATDNLTLTAGGQVNTSTLGQGNGGNVAISATDTIAIDGAGTTVASLVGEGVEGDAGSVTIATDNLTLTAGGQVNTSTLGQGNGGNVAISATDTIAIDGADTAVASAVGEGVEGDAGSVTIDTDNLTLANEGLIITATIGQGNAGDVSIATNNLELSAAGRIITSTGGGGDAGDLTVNATESIFISGVDAEGDSSSGLLSNARINDGNGGNINVVTNQLTINDGGTIDVGNFDDSNASTPGTGEPGNINITADSINLSNQASIEAATQAETGNSANINLQVEGTITLEDNSFISAQAFNNANGGNLIIDTNFIIAFPDGNNDIIANAQQGEGGIIRIDAESILGIEERPLNVLTNDINASSENSDLNGDIIITTSDVNAIPADTELPNNPIESEQTVAQACRSDRSSEQVGSLAIKGKGGIPTEPTEPINSDLILIDGKTSTPNQQAQSPEIEPIKTGTGDVLLARGVIETKDGQIILTAYPTDKIDSRISHVAPNCRSEQELDRS